ncbi:MAG TPA: outer membrane beta-barrel protein, partial [Methylotenera sp.]|nr:outer membrane beta-barrel protein [Methylotenera sp.]
ENSWTGFYVGGNLGYASAESGSDLTSLGGDWSNQNQATRDLVTNNASANQDPSGVSFGFQAGYDHQFDNKFVLGIELDYNELDLHESRQTPLLTSVGATADFAFGNKVDVKHTFSLRPKLGYAIDKTLFYVTAGIAWTSAEFSSTIQSEFNYSKVGKSSKTLTSAIWGIGIEHQFFDNVSAKLEYLKINGDDTSYTTRYRPGSAFTVPAFNETFNADFDYDVVRVGINYRF